jgi:hypothetical protein
MVFGFFGPCAEHCRGEVIGFQLVVLPECLMNLGQAFGVDVSYLHGFSLFG